MVELLGEVAGSRGMQIIKEIKDVLSNQYVAFGLSEDGRLVKEKDILAAVRNMHGGNIVLAAADQEADPRVPVIQ
jgi:hypothetical protein